MEGKWGWSFGGGDCRVGSGSFNDACPVNELVIKDTEGTCSLIKVVGGEDNSEP